MTTRISATITTVITPTTANTAPEELPPSLLLVSDGVVVGVLGVRMDVRDTLVVDVSGVVEAAVIVVCVKLLVSGSEWVVEVVMIDVCVRIIPPLSVSG